MGLLNLYLLFSLLPNLGNFFGVISVLSAGLSFLAVLFGSMQETESYKSKEENDLICSSRSFCLKWSFRLAVIAIISFFINTLIPGEKAIYKIIGAYTVTNIEGVDKLPSNFVKVANDFLENIDLKDEREE